MKTIQKTICKNQLFGNLNDAAFHKIKLWVKYTMKRINACYRKIPILNNLNP